MSDPHRDDFPLPPPPPYPASHQPADGPIMSTGETLTGIFFEPTRVFEALRARPRFLVAGVLMMIVFFTYTALLYSRVGYENVIRSAIENSSRTANMPAEQKERAIAMQSGPVFKTITYASPLIGILIFIVAGGALYLLGTMMMARAISYKQALSVWTYSSFAPLLVSMVLSIVLLYLKSPDDYDVTQAAQRGLARANLGLLVDHAAHPVLATALGSIDLLAFYGLFLAALGLRKVARLSSGSAWAIVLLIWLLGVLVRVGFSALLGGVK